MSTSAAGSRFLVGITRGKNAFFRTSDVSWMIQRIVAICIILSCQYSQETRHTTFISTVYHQVVLFIMRNVILLSVKEKPLQGIDISNSVGCNMHGDSSTARSITYIFLRSAVSYRKTTDSVCVGYDSILYVYRIYNLLEQCTIYDSVTGWWISTIQHYIASIECHICLSMART